MKKKIVKILFILFIVVAIIFGLLIALFFSIFPPDVFIPTPSQVREIAFEKIPSAYQIDSVTSVSRTIEFEGVQRSVKWLKLTLKNKTVTTEDEMFKIAEPICKSLLKSTDYHGIDISPQTTLRTGVGCDGWGP